MDLHRNLYKHTLTNHLDVWREGGIGMGIGMGNGIWNLVLRASHGAEGENWLERSVFT